MKKTVKIMVGIVVLLIVVIGLVWQFFPIYFLRGIKANEIAVIKVLDANNGNEFDVTDSNDILYISSNIQQIAFRKKEISSVAGPWYRLGFVNENGEEIGSLGIQNHRVVRKELSSKKSILFFCTGEIGEIGDYLENLESIQFPDYNKDPDFPYNENDESGQADSNLLDGLVNKAAHCLDAPD